jgi:hypothetical protein
MSGFFSAVDRLLRGQGEFAAAGEESQATRASVRTQLLVIVLCGSTYGAIMGAYGGLAGNGWQQALVSAVKVPWLFTVTFLLCLPSFFVLNVLAGLGKDFRRVLNSLLGFQAIASLVLAAFGPITFLMNVSTDFYSFMVLLNGIFFAVASATGHATMRRMYRPLIQQDHRHGRMYVVWLVLYVFVGIQMAWVLRPFIGAPNLPVQFFRRDAWSNAYVVVWDLILRSLGFWGKWNASLARGELV